MAKNCQVPGEETRTRCKKALEVFQKLETSNLHVAIVVAAGINKKDFPKQTRSLADMMREFLNWKLGIGSLQIHIPREIEWGTKAELKAAFHYLGTLRKRWGKERCEPLHVVTSWYQVPRVWMLAKWGLHEAVIIHASKGSIFLAIPEIWKIPGEFLRMKSPLFAKIVKKVRGRE